VKVDQWSLVDRFDYWEANGNGNTNVKSLDADYADLKGDNADKPTATAKGFC
jgi:hypothetical protein